MFLPPTPSTSSSGETSCCRIRAEFRQNFSFSFFLPRLCPSSRLSWFSFSRSFLLSLPLPSLPVFPLLSEALSGQFPFRVQIFRFPSLIFSCCGELWRLLVGHRFLEFRDSSGQRPTLLLLFLLLLLRQIQPGQSNPPVPAGALRPSRPPFPGDCPGAASRAGRKGRAPSCSQPGFQSSRADQEKALPPFLPEFPELSGRFDLPLLHQELLPQDPRFPLEVFHGRCGFGGFGVSFCSG